MTTPTAEMPMPGGQDQIRLLDAFEKHATILELSLQLPGLADTLEADPVMQSRNFSVSRTVNSIRQDDDNSSAMVKLLHSMEPSAIKAVVRGTVAHDTFVDDAKWFKMPGKAEGKVPGVYVIGLSRDGCDGKFLNILEMEDLVAGIHRYIEGFKLIETLRTDKRRAGTLNERELLQWVGKVQSIDAILPWNVPDKARFIEKDSEVPSIEALASMFKRRCDRALDPTGLVRQVQSPLYVGCSIDLLSRTSCYLRKGLPNVNKPLALTVGVLAALDFPVSLSIQVALRVWTSDHLPLAEQLLATLGGSLVYQSGFNATEAGGTGSSSIKSRQSLIQSRAIIMAYTDTMTKNVDATLAELGRRADFVQKVHEADEALKLLDAQMNEAIAYADEVSQLRNWDEMQAFMAKTEAHMQETLKNALAVRRQWKLLYEINKMLHPDIVVEETEEATE
ncbi:hypothetical protein G7Z17_g12689 [Cylindrodendrum hubeiense]|uniref:Uncharacterized protein n=1 Tax=Cylindrodendrum hubeiense TaxID=595255 RepID=A0A9P5H0E9_9HYPO|nr:hypothetical protein G7Z17_g12689 [Cylindrodendrum hubeiense]